MTRFLNAQKSLMINGFLALLLSACTQTDGLEAKGEARQKAQSSSASLNQKPAALAQSDEQKTTDNPDEATRKIAANFAAAILDGKRKFEAPAKLPQNIGGMRCNPSALPNMTTDFTLSLPADLKARDNNLVVLTPERGVYALYYPYDLNEPAEDYIIPSDQMSWEVANAQSKFTIQPQLFDGMKLGTQERFQIFLENEQSMQKTMAL